MEAKASRISQRSNPGQISAQKVAKTISKASLSPSQMSERTRMAAANKDPLDALSRVGTRQSNADRRCGLQDVDDEYLKTVVYAFAKQANQNSTEKAKVTADMMPAGVPTKRSPARAVGGNEAVSGTATAAPTSTPAVAGSNAVVQEPVQAKIQNQVQQNQQQPAGQLQAQIQSNQQSPPTQIQSQGSPTQAQVAPISPTQDVIPTEKPQQAQKPTTERQTGGGEPELYTTCPNCRATLYLVRNAGEQSQSPYTNQQGDVAQPQAQQQQ